MKRYVINVLFCCCAGIGAVEAFPHKNYTVCEFIAHLMSEQRQHKPQQHLLSSITGYTRHDHTMHKLSHISREVAERIANDFDISPLHNAYREHMCTGIPGIAMTIESAMHDDTEHYNTRMYAHRFLQRQQHNYDQCLYAHAQWHPSFSDAKKACLDAMARIYTGTTIYTVIKQEATFYSDKV